MRRVSGHPGIICSSIALLKKKEEKEGLGKFPCGSEITPHPSQRQMVLSRQKLS
jgi:hypothetical protein